ncbi:MAG: formyltransferase family protein [Thermodesulfobacteriota bacterium]|nr:formyltransferase family protein [Thermodesulfobacteriota bacterium]
MLKVAALVNWGLGLEVVRTLHDCSDVALDFLVTRFDDASKDPWRNRVRDFAEEKGYEVRHEGEIDFQELRNLLLTRDVDVMICHAYMKIIPREVFDAPRLKSVNIHASLLPKYRGGSPHLAVLESGDRESGLTCHYIDEGLDTGEIIHQVKFDLEEGETIESLLEKQKKVVGPLVLELVRRLLSPGFHPTARD